jgi:hypothetical protein
MAERNPGVILLYTTRNFRIFRPDPTSAGVLFEVGEPDAVEWWREGRPATRDEVEESVRTGFPFLVDLAKQDPRPGAIEKLEARLKRAELYFPAA